MTDITEQKALAQTLADHALWLRGEGGSRANLSRTNLSRVDLSGADLSRVDLSKANLSKANLSKANLSGTDLSRANLSKANLSGTDLSRANLSKANLSRTNLSKANLSGTNLSKADLSRTNLSGANLSGTDLSWANLSRTNLSEATVREDLTLGLSIGHASRGDAFTFYAFESGAGEPFIFAGCRAMLLSEYQAHIEKEYPDTAKAKATRACLDYVCTKRALQTMERFRHD